jgi:hypothetical protein
MSGMSKMLRALGALVAVLVAVMWGGVGCEGGGGGSDSSFAGTWALYSGSLGQGTPSWYVHFISDGTFSISDNQDGSGVRVTGTYTESGGTLTGPFTNPGVGDGRVEATITDNVINLSFIEYWHTPNKVVPYVGSKL